MLISMNMRSQEIVISVTNKPLNDVLADLKNNYGVQFSFNTSLLSKCKITENATFKNSDEAIIKLLTYCNLDFEKSGDVYIIFESKKPISKPNLKKKQFVFSGKILDNSNGESLPYSNILINSTGFCSDVNGNFSFKATDSLIRIQVSHLGYFLLDSNICGGSNIKILMKPATIELKEIIVKSDSNISKIHIGEKPGFIKLNKRMVTFMTGSNENTIFDLLRLQPGIMAAGEQSHDYRIWGSYNGQNLILLDGIPLFNISAGNENIGPVNSLLIKDVEVCKAGFNAETGGKVGGLVTITGKTGVGDSLYTDINVNNLSASGIVNIPISNDFSVQTAFRKTFYNLFNTQNLFSVNNKEKYDVFDSKLSFIDLNIKAVGKNKNGDVFSLNLSGSIDNSLDNYYEGFEVSKYLIDNEKRQKQFSGGLNYNKCWKTAGATDFSVYFSGMKSEMDYSTYYYDPSQTGHYLNQHSSILTSISDFSIKSAHSFVSGKINSVNLGIGLTRNSESFGMQEEPLDESSYSENQFLLSAYIKDKISVSKTISIQPGFRTDFHVQSSRIFLQPRFQATIKPTKKLSFNLAWGKYNQFITENSLMDPLGNYFYYWGIVNDKTPALESYHNIFGTSYSFGNSLISVEGFFKNINNLTRFFTSTTENELLVSHGKAKAYGCDVYLKRTIRKHEFWISYTLSKTSEHFDYFTGSDFQQAPHDQRHEIKGAGLLNFHPWYFSVNYVYGSGFPNISNLESISLEKIVPYKRLDLAVMYKFTTKKFKLETGFSIINVLNIYNVRYNNFSSFPDEKIIYQRAMPFTPSLFLNFRI